ncbi:MAG: hypothetical protein C4520_14470 [Candidatus Abyssobacteria bacterium SURF_5]|uniref:N-acetylmuramoyl-L-alanine amidase n=1 Tax=Abyssobacteria bacterium (strain SURF_5) TaxID=2093360 RepID=A0A3A4NRN1_ABYX5|nr:MAG: hypothetical protein C4520_14470 [Candidatus Abyssubacteria bacterium SURF_5]
MKKKAASRLPCISISLVLASLTLGGCARQVVVTPQAALDYGQITLRQAPPNIDVSALRGRRIVLDPGHGGSFVGAIGPNNLREADVNLGVALYLWGMLTQAGAEVHLTRTDDSNVYKAADIEVKKDLHARVEFAQAHDPDLFVSLHHNADVLPGAKRNSLETYFKMKDPGPSLDAAQHIHKQLALSLNQPDNAILPGNYHVLREFAGPAVLGEPSFISHAFNAFRLGLAPTQRVEAQAYFLGIAEYFAKGVPKVEIIEPLAASPNDARPMIVARVTADRGVPIDPASIEMRIDGAPVSATFDPASSLVHYLPERRFSNGNHTVDISLRNVNGNAARTAATEFDVVMPPAYILLDTNIRTVPLNNKQQVRLAAKIFDADAMPIADGTRAEFTASEGLSSPAVSYTTGGEAIVYLAPGGAGGPRTINASIRAGDLSHNVNLYVRDDAPSFSVFHVFDATRNAPVANALVTVDGRPLGYTDRAGYFAAGAGEISGSFLTVSAPGYIPRTVDCASLAKPSFVKLKPIADGLLFGKKIAIDPQLGGEEKGQTGPTGVRSSDLNLRAARYLAEFLKASGAQVVLTRESDMTATLLRRVELAEQSAAELFISIGHGGLVLSPLNGESAGAETRPADAYSLHYPNSKDGARLAATIAGHIEVLGVAQRALVQPATDFVLTHTAAPATIVALPGPSSAETEDRLRDPDVARREAYAVYCGILEYIGLEKERTGRLVVRVRGEDKSAPALITLDGALTVRCASGSDFTFRCLAPGEHRLQVLTGGKTIQDYTVVIEANQTAVAEVVITALQ